MALADDYGVLPKEEYKEDCSEDDLAYMNEINLPFFIKDHPRKCHNVKELNEEYNFYREVIKDITDKEYFEELSNEDGSEVLDHLGEFCIWYKVNDKIKLEKILTYRDVTLSGIGPGGLKCMMEYLIKYFNMFRGKVIQFIYFQENAILWSYKDGIYSKFDISTDCNKYYSWV